MWFRVSGSDGRGQFGAESCRAHWLPKRRVSAPDPLRGWPLPPTFHWFNNSNVVMKLCQNGMPLLLEPLSLPLLRPNQNIWCRTGVPKQIICACGKRRVIFNQRVCSDRYCFGQSSPPFVLRSLCGFGHPQWQNRRRFRNLMDGFWKRKRWEKGVDFDEFKLKNEPLKGF